MYAVGGYDSSSQLRTVERYCTVTDSWEFVAPMKSPRSALSVAVLGGKLYALGEGFSCSCTVKLVLIDHIKQDIFQLFRQVVAYCCMKVVQKAPVRAFGTTFIQ